MASNMVPVDDDLGIVKFKGVFDLAGLLRMTKDWIVHNGYDFYENKHKAKLPEMELKWRGEKKVTGYYRYHINIFMHFFDVHEVEVIVDGEKKKLYHARFLIKFGGGIERNWAESWNENENTGLLFFKKFAEKYQSFYENFLVKRELIAVHADALVNNIRSLMNKTKSFLGMEGSY